MLSCVIIDDELHGIKLLSVMLEKRFADSVVLRGSACNAEAGIQLINDTLPDLVFLDVEMPGETGLQMLSHFPDRTFSVVFTTAHTGYALEAIKKEAADYLLKPIALDELTVALERCEKRLAQQDAGQDKKATNTISLPTHKGLRVTLLSDIIRMEAENNYTIVHFAGIQKIVVARTLGLFEEKLKDAGFYRIHHSHLINMAHLVSYETGERSYASLTDGKKIEIARRRKSGFLKKINID